MLIDCDTCTARGQGCHDCVVTVLLGAPPGSRGGDPAVVPLTRRPVVPAQPHPASLPFAVVDARGVVVELDEVEARAVRVLADARLVPPLRHQAPRRDVG